MASQDPRYALSQPELDSITNGGNYPESAAARQRRLETDLQMGQARIQKLEHLIALGGQEEEKHKPGTLALAPEYQAGGKFALSAAEQKWATAATASTEPWDRQLERKYQQVAQIQKDLQSISH